MNIGLVCVIGIGTVFAGLICLILISYIMSFFCQKLAKPQTEEKSANIPATPQKSTVPAAIPNKQELVAAICTVIAEELGTDVSNIRVTSFKRV